MASHVCGGNHDEACALLLLERRRPVGDDRRPRVDHRAAVPRERELALAVVRRRRAQLQKLVRRARKVDGALAKVDGVFTAARSKLLREGEVARAPEKEHGGIRRAKGGLTRQPLSTNTALVAVPQAE